MFITLFGSVEQGIIYAIMALGVYLTFRVLDFPDLTVDGSFVTGAATAATMIVLGYSPIIATLVAVIAGFLAGCMTGLLHTKGNINPLLSGILMMIALYSINLRIMGLTTEAVGRPNIPLLSEQTIFSQVLSWWSNLGIDTAMNNMLAAIGIPGVSKTWSVLFVGLIIIIIIKIFVDTFLKTEVGLAIRATGDNQRMIRSFSANTGILITLGLGISNGLVALAGALIAQVNKSADVTMGVGMIVTGLASVIIGEAVLGTKTIMRTTIAVIIGAIIYRMVLALALQSGFLDAGDMKLITAVIVIIALILPQLINKYKDKKRKAARLAQMKADAKQGGSKLA